MEFKEAIDLVGQALDGVGVAVIVGGILVSTVGSVRRLRLEHGRESGLLFVLAGS